MAPATMTPDTRPVSISPTALWTGRIMSFLPALFLFVDAVMKLMRPEMVVKTTVELGYPESVIIGLGVVLLTSTILYLLPRTAVIGAILLTGYLGGAVATHVRVNGGLFPVFFPIIFGVLLWGGLFFRDERLRRLISLTR
jgi:hypothetical protein